MLSKNSEVAKSLPSWERKLKKCKSVKYSRENLNCQYVISYFWFSTNFWLIILQIWIFSVVPLSYQNKIQIKKEQKSKKKQEVEWKDVVDSFRNDDSIFLVLSILSIFLVYWQTLNTTLKAILGPNEIDKGYIFK